MKNLILSLSLLSSFFTVHAQIIGPGYPCGTLPCCLNCYTTVWYDTLDLSENVDMFHADTLNGTDLWHFGNTTKISFANQQGFVTDTINSYPVNAKGILEYRMPRYYNGILLFEHKFDTDSLTDGGYVRVSCDHGQSWNIAGTQEIDNAWCSSNGTGYVNYPNFPWMATPPTIQDTIPAFTGSSDWHWSAIQFSDISVFQENTTSKTASSDSIYFQFVFESDAVDSGKDGWMIRKIVNAFADVVSGIDDHLVGQELVYYPNPTTNTIRIDFGSEVGEVTIETYSALGKLIQTGKQALGGFIEYELPQPKGVYLIKVMYSDGKINNLKVVKE